MTRPTQPGPRKPSAFTLIELLVVMGIIAILAAMIFPAGKAIRESATRNKVKAELHQLQAIIDSYKAKLGFYPPDNPLENPNNYLKGYRTNQLYFELSGSILLPPPTDLFQTLDGSAEILTSAVQAIFGVSGFVNCTKGAGDDNSRPAKNFLKGLKGLNTSQSGGVSTAAPQIKILACSVAWPVNHPFQPVPDNPGLNPWRYNSSSPTNNPNSYDLWVDVLIGGKTNRISNWSEQPQFVN
jgi:prepilin-type N-terminal cleavage/methylation domain-containing protein